MCLFGNEHFTTFNNYNQVVFLSFLNFQIDQLSDRFILGTVLYMIYHDPPAAVIASYFLLLTYLSITIP